MEVKDVKLCISIIKETSSEDIDMPSVYLTRGISIPSELVSLYLGGYY